MKLNKKELAAIGALDRLCNALKLSAAGKDTLATLTTAEYNLLRDVLGIHVDYVTKTEINKKQFEFVRGKEALLAEREWFCKGHNYEHRYYPFQVKKVEKNHP